MYRIYLCREAHGGKSDEPRMSDGTIVDLVPVS